MKNASVSLLVGPEIGQIQEINMAVLRGATGFLKRLPGSHAQQLVGKPSIISDAVAQALEALIPKRMIIPHNEAERWQKYYRDQYGIECALAGLEIPATPAYPSRLIVMHADVSNRPQRIATVYKNRCGGKWWQFAENLDVAVPKHVRSGTYGIWVADVPEAPDGFDEERQTSLSSQDTCDRGWITTTLPERLVDGDMYLLERGVHLDQKVVTLCPGSRLASGLVPRIDLGGGGRVGVRCWDPGGAGDSLRFRRAIV